MKRKILIGILLLLIVTSVWVLACGDPWDFWYPPTHLNNYSEYPPGYIIKAMVKPAFYEYLGRWSMWDHTYIGVYKGGQWWYYSNPSLGSKSGGWYLSGWVDGEGDHNEVKCIATHPMCQISWGIDGICHTGTNRMLVAARFRIAYPYWLLWNYGSTHVERMSPGYFPMVKEASPAWSAEQLFGVWGRKTQFDCYNACVAQNIYFDYSKSEVPPYYTGGKWKWGNSYPW